ncbi:MAG: DUF3043 domain-containing protein [Propionibacteriaceae bacterium]
MGLFRPYQRDEAKTSNAKASDLVITTDTTQTAPVEGKGRPTPSRKQAEAARMERLHPTLSKRERKAADRATARASRYSASDQLEKRPERVLLRNFIDNSWHISEFIMPVMILVLLALILTRQWPQISFAITVFMWALFLVAIADMAITWWRFKRVLRERLPEASKRGLLVYAINRMIQIRRFRIPGPAIKRGAGY